MKLFFKLALIASFLWPVHIFGQQTDDVKISNLPYYSYRRGLGLTSPDSVFQFNIRFRIQNRFSYLRRNSSNAFDGQIRRLRLRFDGYVGNPKFTYALQLSFAPGDVGEIEEGENINIIRDAVVFYNPDSHFQIGFGQTKLPGNRQRVNSSGALQLSDRTISNARFNIDRDFGIFFNYFNHHKTRFSYNLRNAISMGEGRNYTKNPDNGLAYTTKLEVLPFGTFSNDGVYFEGDLFREKKPKLMLSAAYHLNHKARREAGVLGNELFGTRNLKSWLADMVFKYQGWSIMASYMSRKTPDPVTLGPDNQKATVYTGHGSDLQGSYTFPKKLEIIGRFSRVVPDNAISQLFPKHRQYTIGLCQYIWEHAFKLQLEGSLNRYQHFNMTRSQDFYVRFQVEMGI